DAFKVARILDHPDKVRGIEGLAAEMIGRDTELGVLRTALADGGVVAVIAPAGVGKSRLAAEFRTEVAAVGGTWLEGRCLELTSTVAYAPFVDLLTRRLERGDPSDTVAAVLDELVEAGTITADRCAEILPFLVHLLGEELGDRRDLRVTESDDEQRRTLTTDALVTFLTAHPSPTVVCLEDVHWSDPRSRAVVQALSDGPLVLLTLRPDIAVDELGDQVRELRLAELTPEDGRRLVAALLDISGLPAWLEARIVHDAAGNPFYVEELIRSLIQRGAITRQDGRWQVSANDVDLDLPPSVEGVLMSRFDRLGDATRRAARAASVLDPDFGVELFDELAGTDLVPELDTLTRAGLLRIVPDSSTRYAFVHALGRQAVYSSLLPSQRAELHEQAGRALEPSGDVDRIAYHYARSRNHAKAVEWLLQAGRRALDTFATDAALPTLEDGLARVDELPESDQHRWRAEYQFSLGRLLGRMARHTEARQALEAALTVGEFDPLREAEIWRRLGQNHRLEDDLDSAHACYDRTERILDTQPDDDTAARREWIRVQKERAFALYFGGRGRELPAHNARVGPVVARYGTDAQRADHLYGEVLSSFVAVRFAVTAATVAKARHALELAERGADAGRVAEGRFVLGFALLWADQMAEAAEVLTQAVEETTRLGTVTEACRALAYRAIALRRLGRVDEAATAARDALEAAERIGSDYYVGHALAVMCWVAWRRGEPGCAEYGGRAERAWGTLERDGVRGLNCEFAWLAAWPLAASASDRGDPVGAAEQLRLLLVPWERPMPSDLADLVARAVEDPGLLAACLRGAEQAGFL
ncbi:MAG: ATP-binding protein, partial [Acidimicrobiia bacterium]